MKNKYIKRAILILIDIGILLFSGYIAVAAELETFLIPADIVRTTFKFLPFDIVIMIAVFWAFHLYHGVWSFVSVPDMMRTGIAVVIVNMIFIAYRELAFGGMNLTYYTIMFLLMLALVMASRVSVRILNHYKHKLSKSDDRKKTMIVGAGSAANILIHELDRNDEWSNDIVCVIDDNPGKKGKYIRGVKIIGNRDEIQKACKEYDVDEIIIAMPSVSAKNKREIIEICKETGCRVRILPELTKTLTGMMSQNLRDVNIQDLIGREPIKVNDESIDSYITGETVLVTGGGGSIGSELCRQIMSHRPEKLIIFDIYENNAYAIQQELIRKYGSDCSLEVLIGSVRDYDRLESVFAKYRPTLVFHAAAHKHVPLMEDAPNEAVKNNCYGTLNAVKLADKYKVKSFILISTDKAVRPTNVMGATKRICEMIIQSYAAKSETKFAAVRFGNVLGSNGSVVPLFMKQIQEGGPVTVTHKDITRFFMTIPEAVSLVLQASIYAHGGEIFVLDMGEPVRIYDLAETLIRMQGHVPNEDIEIKIVGLRPGEKLYEEILMEEEGLRKTENELIHIGSPIEMDYDKFEDNLIELIKDSYNNTSNIKERVREVCDTYVITENR